MGTPITIESADQRALSAMLAHHEQLSQGLDGLLDALRAAVADGQPFEQKLGALTAFLAVEILPHAAAEEATLYQAAAGEATTALFIESMLLEHRELRARTRAIASAHTPIGALGSAEAVTALFAVHVRKENELLLPALAELPGADLTALLADMQSRISQPAPATVAAEPEELDVTTLAHGSRHEIIFERLHALASDATLIIVNDHDPKPLRFQLDAAWPNSFSWDYLESGPQLWRIAITKLS